ncbi:MAG: ATP synthase F1 subunit gamma, partial [Bacilli bacterium]|nr:ATP synthase F1 subunit gamma [Bacilli bacterium]
LAGGYNNNLIKNFENDVNIKHQSNDEFIVGVLGQKGFRYFVNKDINLLNTKPVNMRDDVQFVDIIDIIQLFIDMYLVGEIDEIIIYYNKYINTIKQEVSAERIIPIDKIEGNQKPILYEFEPSPQKVLDTLMPIYVQNLIYGYILNAKTSEHASRMTAMKSATDNAEEVIDKLTLHYNRARQAQITQEITEIVSGAAALK